MSIYNYAALRKAVLFVALAILAASLFVVGSKPAAAATSRPSCISTAPVYYIPGNLLWYGHADPTGGSAAWASGTGNTVGSNWAGLQAFSGGNGIIYGIDSAGNLRWYRHLGYLNGTSSWASGSGNAIGSSWGGFTSVFSGGDGVIYGIDTAGNLHWYRHLGYLTGSSGWATGSGNVVGTSWSNLQAFSGGNGIIYTVDGSGSLHWYRHLGYLTGSSSWASGSGNVVSNGWGRGNGILSHFSAGGGIIYAINSTGHLYWYDHLGYLNGSSSWASGSGNAIGSGWSGDWSTFADVDACGNSVAYAQTHWTWEWYNTSSTSYYTVSTGASQPNFECAEFVARSLAANGYFPGLDANTSTSNQYASYQGYSLAYVPDLYSYLINNHLGVDVGDNPAQAAPGDIAFYRNGSGTLEHAALLVQVGTTRDGSDTLVDAHNDADYQIPYNNYQAWNGYSAHIVHLY
ncbi:tachylectin-related carbohydrate-binding protein [Tengunoibacter tsumagoiensis]|uniref:tachylectin-related carbohydrate-binding protein n=1 Tax=Tengunoibacter tsumagoiensis TaxID=2014871 RepID=UPI0013868C07|nr:tachylectin-related carbohydrate-binding protein [Tengunoibacter tsumagoiensis]